MTPNDLLEAEDTQSEYDKGFDDIIARNYGKTAPSDTVDNSIGNAEEILGEQNKKPGPDSTDSGWTDNTGKSINTGGNKFKTAVALAKKRGGLIGLIGLFGVTGGILASLFAPASVLISLMENATDRNDTSSVAMQRRFMKVFGFATKGDSDIISRSKIAKSMGGLSNKALYDLHKKGVTALIGNTPYDGKSKIGYPAARPTAYVFDDGSGAKTTVPKDELPDFLSKKENRKLAAKVLGRGGAFNLRLKAWTGKHITNRLFSKFPTMDRRGDVDVDNKKLSPTERLAAAEKKLLSKIPGFKNASSVLDDIRLKVNRNMKSIRRAGLPYTIAVAGCMAAKAPKLIAGGVAAVQLAQLAPIGLNNILTPGSKGKASYISNISSQETENSAVLITNKTPREGDGKMTNALDSKYLQYATGVNKNKPTVSPYAPGLSIMQDERFKIGMAIDDKSRPACDVLMSPAVMYSYMAIDSAVTVVAAGTIIGGIFKVVGTWVASNYVASIVSDQIGNAAMTAVTSLAENDAIPKARGEAFGDVLGTSLIAFYAIGGKGRALPGLKVSQLANYNQSALEVRQFERELAVASLSPFDISSKYTALGSIVHNARTAAAANGSSLTNVASFLTSLPSLPFSLLSSPAQADVNLTAEYCGYATDFMYDVPENSNDLPAINAAGLPCTGLTPEQEGMSTAEAIQIMVDNGWINEDAEGAGEIDPSYSIDMLIEKGYIVADTPLYDFIATCGDATSGSYLFEAAGCTINSQFEEGSLENVTEKLSTQCYEGEGEETICYSDLQELEGGDSSSISTVDNRSLSAMSVFLLDYQMIKAINGEDEGADNLSTAEDPQPLDESEAVINDGTWAAPMKPGTYTITSAFGPRWGSFHNGVDLASPMNVPYYAASGGRVTFVGMESWGTYYIKIDHGGGISTEYGHSYPDQVLVCSNKPECSTVRAGQLIAYVGNQGSTVRSSRGVPTRSNGYGAHLHFNYRENGKVIDPEDAMLTHGIKL